MLFDADKCFLIPQALDGIRSIVAMHQAHPAAKVLIVGHEGGDEVTAGPDIALARAKVLSGATQGRLAALIVFPIAAVVHAPGVHAHLAAHWAIVVTVIPLACVMMTSLGLLLGTAFEPRNIGLMFGFVVLPITFLGGTYYQWSKLAALSVGGVHWLQIIVLANPLIYVNEGLRAGLTSNANNMHLYVVYPALIGFSALFLTLGLRNFRSRVLS